MKQFTMNIDEALLQAAKAHALERGRTVSDVIRESLATEVGWTPDASRVLADDVAIKNALHGFSEGRLTRRQAMASIGLTPDRYVDFVGMMADAKTPWPPVDRASVEAEGEVVARAISGALDED